MSDFTTGRRPGEGNKARAVRRGANRNALQDLYLILLIYCSDLETYDAKASADSLRANINRWAHLYNLMGSSFSYGKPTDQPKAVAPSSLDPKG